MSDDIARRCHCSVTCTLKKTFSERIFHRRLKQFESLIKDITMQHVEASTEERRHLITETLRFDDFCESIRRLFGNDVKKQDIQTIFQKIRTNPDARIDWSELFGYHSNGSADESGKQMDGGQIFAVSQRQRIGDASGDRRRRDVAIVITYIPNLDCYVTVSQKGSLTVWRSKNLRLQSCMDVGDRAWVTTGDYLPNIRRMAVCQERSISLFDVRATGKKQQQQRFVVHPLENAIQCASSIITSTSSHRDTLLYGDDEGYVGLLTIDATDLTTNKTNSPSANRTTKTTTSASTTTAIMLDPNKLTHPRYRRKLHNEWVSKVKYFPQLRCFGSCSADSSASFVLDSIEAICDDRTVKGFSVPKGVNAFDYCATANLIATGGVDKIIRVWHPNIFTAPIGKLIGHLFTIVDIVINQADQHIISLSSARVIRVWDVSSMTLIQVFMDNDEIPGEKKVYSISYNEKYEHLITGSSVLEMWPLTRAVQDRLQIPHTHDRPITQMIRNEALSQLLTACAESTIKSWDLQTGRLLFWIPSAHEPDMEVTAFAVDATGYRLASGAIDGSIRVWDAGSGQELKWRKGHARNSEDDAQRVIDLSYCKVDGVRCIAAVGCKNYVRFLDDSKTSRDLPVLKEFDFFAFFSLTCLTTCGNRPVLPPLPVKTSTLSSELYSTKKNDANVEVTCADLLDFSSKQIFATGLSSGKVLLWNIANMEVKYTCQIPNAKKKSKNTESDASSSSNSQAVLAMNFLLCKESKSEPNNQEYDSSSQNTKSDELLTYDRDQTPLMKKLSSGDNDRSAESRRTCSSEIKPSDPVLVTCHADAIIRFWNLKGCFLGDVPNSRSGKITACTSNTTGLRLFTADNKGYVAVWGMDTFLENMENVDHIEQLLSWRSHQTRIVQIQYVDSTKLILTASTDCSVRIWSSYTGCYLGYFGQPQKFDLSVQLPSPAATLASENLPYDINEGPQSPERKVRESVAARQRAEAKQLVEYPLIFDNKRWIPFRRSAYLGNRGIGRVASNLVASSNRKFFEALKKSAPCKDLIESYVTGDMNQGAIYRALPVYRISTPERIKTPEFSLPKIDNDKTFRFDRAKDGGEELIMEMEVEHLVGGTGQISNKSKKKTKNIINRGIFGGPVR